MLLIVKLGNSNQFKGASKMNLISVKGKLLDYKHYLNIENMTSSFKYFKENILNNDQLDIMTLIGDKFNFT